MFQLLSDEYTQLKRELRDLKIAVQTVLIDNPDWHEEMAEISGKVQNVSTLILKMTCEPVRADADHPKSEAEHLNGTFNGYQQSNPSNGAQPMPRIMPPAMNANNLNTFHSLQTPGYAPRTLTQQPPLQHIWTTEQMSIRHVVGQESNAAQIGRNTSVNSIPIVAQMQVEAESIYHVDPAVISRRTQSPLCASSISGSSDRIALSSLKHNVVKVHQAVATPVSDTSSSDHSLAHHAVFKSYPASDASDNGYSDDALYASAITKLAEKNSKKASIKAQLKLNVKKTKTEAAEPTTEFDAIKWNQALTFDLGLDHLKAYGDDHSEFIVDAYKNAIRTKTKFPHFVLISMFNCGLLVRSSFMSAFQVLLGKIDEFVLGSPTMYAGMGLTLATLVRADVLHKNDLKILYQALNDAARVKIVLQVGRFTKRDSGKVIY